MKTIKVKTAKDLVQNLSLTPLQGAVLAFRYELNSQIIKIVKNKKVTHARLAKLTGSSRTRMTALLNHNISDISTDLMLRVLSALGYKIKPLITKTA